MAHFLSVERGGGLTSLRRRSALFDSCSSTLSNPGRLAKLQGRFGRPEGGSSSAGHTSVDALSVCISGTAGRKTCAGRETAGAEFASGAGPDPAGGAHGQDSHGGSHLPLHRGGAPHEGVGGLGRDRRSAVFRLGTYQSGLGAE